MAHIGSLSGRAARAAPHALRLKEVKKSSRLRTLFAFLPRPLTTAGAAFNPTERLNQLRSVVTLVLLLAGSAPASQPQYQTVGNLTSEECKALQAVIEECERYGIEVALAQVLLDIPDQERQRSQVARENQLRDAAASGYQQGGTPSEEDTGAPSQEQEQRQQEPTPSPPPSQQPIVAITADGWRHEFPAGTDRAVIDRVMKAYGKTAENPFHFELGKTPARVLAAFPEGAYILFKGETTPRIKHTPAPTP